MFVIIQSMSAKSWQPSVEISRFCSYFISEMLWNWHYFCIAPIYIMLTPYFLWTFVVRKLW